jgi:drug/metabolite transporter (DMT)-like permease
MSDAVGSEAAGTVGTFAGAPAPGRRGVLRAYLSVGVATFCWSSNVVAVKLILRDIPAFSTGVLRITLTALTLASIRLLQRRSFSVRAVDRATVLQLGTMGIAASFLSFTGALAHTSVAHTVFIGALVPMAVLLLARLQGQERITPVKLAGLLVCLVGVALLALDEANGGSSDLIGDALAFVGMCCFSFFTVTSKRLATHYDSLSLVTYAFLVAALCVLPFTLWSIASLSWSQLSGVTCLALLYSASFGSAGAYLSYYFSLRTLTASQVAAFQYVQPILGTCFGALILAEIWGPNFLSGAALILAGMLLAERR